MSTNINISVGDNKLLDQVRLQQNASRQAQLDKEDRARLATAGATERTNALAARGFDATGNLLTGSPNQVPRLERRPAATRTGLESFTFAPSIQGETWVTSDATSYPLQQTNLNLYTASQYAGAITYSPTGGPSTGTPKLRATAQGWRSLGAQNSKFIPKQSTGGITLEHWVNFGPHGTRIYNENKDARVVSAISASPIGLSDIFGTVNVYADEPNISLRATILADEDSPTAGGITISCEVDPTSGFRRASKRVISGFLASDNAGWNHFACEVLFDGSIYLYFNGQRLTLTEDDYTGSIVPLNFTSQTDSFLPILIAISNSYINASGIGDDGTPRPWVDAHGVRYTKGLRYRGGSFVPLPL